jgi:hypothetical protein
MKNIGQAEHELARARQVNQVALPESRPLS